MGLAHNENEAWILLLIVLIIKMDKKEMHLYSPSLSGRPSGLMANALTPGESSPGVEPCPRGLCCILEQDTELDSASPTEEYKWVLANCGEVTCNGLASRPEEVGILRISSASYESVFSKVSLFYYWLIIDYKAILCAIIVYNIYLLM